MPKCLDCGAQSAENATQCPSCGIAFIAANTSGYKPSWLGGEEKGKKRGRRDKITTDPVQSEVVRKSEPITQTPLINRRPAVDSQPITKVEDLARDLNIHSDQIPSAGESKDNANVSATKVPYAPTPVDYSESSDEDDNWLSSPPSTTVRGERIPNSNLPRRNNVDPSVSVEALRRAKNFGQRDDQIDIESFFEKPLPEQQVVVNVRAKGLPSLKRRGGEGKASNKILLILSLIIVLLGGGYFGFNQFISPKSTTDAKGFEEVLVKPVGNYGEKLTLALGSDTDRSVAQLKASMFMLGCDRTIADAKGIAIVLPSQGLSENHSAAVSMSAPVQGCLDDKIAYLFDGKSVLEVAIAAHDSNIGMVWLDIPAPLPGQPITLDNGSDDNLAGIFDDEYNAKLVEVTTGMAPGTPIFNSKGRVMALIGVSGTQLATERICSSIAACPAK